MAARGAALIALLLAAGSASAQDALITPQPVPRSGPPVAFTAEGDFSPAAVRNGVLATHAQCEAIGPGAAWARSPDGESACLRYWAEGFPVGAAAQRALVYFTGDIWEGHVIPNYRELARSVPGLVKDWAAALGLPVVLVARPGTYGSSGDHMQRRRPAESQLVSSALDAIKARHGIAEFAAVGYSGGGHVVTSLLNHRSDIVCAVPTASVASPRLRASLRRWTRDSTGYEDSYEPLDHLDKARLHKALRVFIVGDPRDRNGVWPAQTIMKDKLDPLGVPTHVLEVTGTGPQRHWGMGDMARQVGAWCAAGLPSDEILSRVRR